MGAALAWLAHPNAAVVLGLNVRITMGSRQMTMQCADCGQPIADQEKSYRRGTHTWHWLCGPEPRVIEHLKADAKQLREALTTCEAWIDRWTSHIGHCLGGDHCTCGRTAVLYEARAAIANEQFTTEERDGNQG